MGVLFLGTRFAALFRLISEQLSHINFFAPTVISLFVFVWLCDIISFGLQISLFCIDNLNQGHWKRRLWRNWMWLSNFSSSSSSHKFLCLACVNILRIDFWTKQKSLEIFCFLASRFQQNSVVITSCYLICCKISKSWYSMHIQRTLIGRKYAKKKWYLWEVHHIWPIFSDLLLLQNLCLYHWCTLIIALA